MTAVQVRVTIGIEARYCKGEERIAMILTGSNRYSEDLSASSACSDEIRALVVGYSDERPHKSWFATVFWWLLYMAWLSFPNAFDVWVRYTPWWFAQTQGRCNRGRYSQEVSSWSLEGHLLVINYFEIRKKKSKSKSNPDKEKEREREHIKELLLKEDDYKTGSPSGSGRNSPAVGGSNSKKTEAERRFEEIQKRRVRSFLSNVDRSCVHFLLYSACWEGCEIGWKDSQGPGRWVQQPSGVPEWAPRYP